LYIKTTSNLKKLLFDVLFNSKDLEKGLSLPILFFTARNSNDNFQTNDEIDYQRHVISKHPVKPCYPSKPDLERLGLKGMGKDWEI
jgi:hypothetical protein